MIPPHRHQLRQLSAVGWRDVLSRDWDDEARTCLGLWAARDLPLVVTRQPAGQAPRRVALGLPAPGRFGRRRFALDADPADTRLHAGFPPLAAIAPRLAALLAPLGCDARVYGSHGWQALTGLDHLHRDSDLDLLLPVASEAMADAVCALLRAADAVPRLDGELLFPGDAAVAWREWAARQTSRGLLVKRSAGVSIEHGVPC